MSLPGLRRASVGGSLIIAPALGLVGTVVQPTVALSAVALFAVSQAFWVIGYLGIAHVTSGRSPILATLGAALACLGALGHTVIAGALSMQVIVARTASTAEAATAMAAAQNGPLIPFLLLGLAGTALGIALLAIAVMRARTAPLWVPILLLVAVAWDFTLSNLGGWAAAASPVVVLIAAGALGVHLLRADLHRWTDAPEVSAQAGVVPPHGHGIGTPIGRARPRGDA